MEHARNRDFGAIVSRLIAKRDLSRQEARDAFSIILKNETTEHQQGAFLAALCAKGETKEEVAGAWEAIYELDTVKVSGLDPEELVENSGTGMDSFKTFNISTGASIVAAACGVKMARHGARALSSRCGTVDLAEALGVDVECPPELVAESIRAAGIGLFNGMSPTVHPMALGRILSRIHFGSTLNISASLANPALPKLAVRGVYSRAMLDPVAEVMREIGYARAVVLHGAIDGSDAGMDEASVCGATECVELKRDGSLARFSLQPEELGFSRHPKESLAPETDANSAAAAFLATLSGSGPRARVDAVALNAAFVLYVAGKAASIADGVDLASVAIHSGEARATLDAWVRAQNRDPEAGILALKSHTGLS